MEQQPSPGRIVHVVLPDGPRAGSHRAAVITSEWDGPNQNLTIFHDQCDDDAGGAFNQLGRAWSAPYDETGERPGSWHWPERVPATGAPATPAAPVIDPAPSVPPPPAATVTVDPAANNPA